MGCAPSKEEPGQIALKDVQADVAINSGRRMTETKRRIAVRAETTDLEEAFTPPTYPKSEDAKDRIRQGVVQNAQGDGLLKELKMQCRGEIGAFATPDVIHWAPALPKTRSGKIMRR